MEKDDHSFEETVYRETCKNCNQEISVRAQEDRSPEYYTDVGVLCKCGKYVWFCLPVN